MKDPVLICIDDEEIVLKSLKRELTNSFGEKYLIETTEDGNDALKILEEFLNDGHDVPVVIADQIMPYMKGDDLLARMHALSPKTLKIMLTGQADKQAITNAVNKADLYRYIAKPWDAMDLELTIKEAIRGYFQDKAIEKQLQLLRGLNANLEQKVKDRTSELERQQEELRQLNANKDKFFSIIAHDLRTPFTGLLGISDFIVKNVEKFGQRDVKEHVASMREATETVYLLLENLLAWAQLQQGMLDAQPQLLSLREIADRNTAFFAARAVQKKLSLKNKISPTLQVYADKGMLNTIMRNLVSNAVKFTKSGGMIELSAMPASAFVDVVISDTGVGIERSALPLLFRIDTKYSTPGTAEEEGTGLGLILTKALIEKNNGQIRLESEPKQGTIVTVRLLAAPAK